MGMLYFKLVWVGVGFLELEGLGLNFVFLYIFVVILGGGDLVFRSFYFIFFVLEGFLVFEKVGFEDSCILVIFFVFSF